MVRTLLAELGEPLFSSPKLLSDGEEPLGLKAQGARGSSSRHVRSTRAGAALMCMPPPPVGTGIQLRVRKEPAPLPYSIQAPDRAFAGTPDQAAVRSVGTPGVTRARSGVTVTLPVTGLSVVTWLAW